MKKLTPYLFILIALLLGACSTAPKSASTYGGTAGGGDMAESESFYAPAAEPAAFDEEAAYNRASQAMPDSDTSSQLNPGERIILKDASLSISVQDPAAKMESILDLAEEMGGWVVYSELYFRTLESGAEVPQATVNFRVPAQRLEEAMAAVEEGVGMVLAKNISGRDVTEDYTDLSSRLVTLKAAEAELLKIMDEAKDTEDVLNVFNQLTNIQSQIEVLEGRIRYYEESAAFSSVNVEILADEAVQPLTIGGWQPVGVAKEAIQALINTLTGIADMLIWIIVFLPVFALFYFFYRLIRRMIKRRRNINQSA